MAVKIYRDGEVEKIAAAADIADAALSAAVEALAGGATIEETDRAAAETIRELGGVPIYDGYEGFPNEGAIVAIDDEVCNAIATSLPPHDGDLLKVSVAVELDGYHAKVEETFFAGRPPEGAELLVRTAHEALEAGIAMIAPGKRLGDIGSAIQELVEGRGFSVIRDYVGHGIGRELHEPPQVSGTGRPGTGMRLKAGMVLYVMAIICDGDPEVEVQDDGWTATTADGGLAATAAQMIVVAADGARRLPASRRPRPAHLPVADDHAPAPERRPSPEPDVDAARQPQAPEELPPSSRASGRRSFTTAVIVAIVLLLALTLFLTSR